MVNKALWTLLFQLAIASILIPSSADALPIIFVDDKVGFLAQTGATDVTGPLPDLGLIPPGSGASSTTVGSVTLTAPRWFMSEWTTLLPGPDVAISIGFSNVPIIDGGDGLDAQFSSLVFSAGFDFVEPSIGDGPTGPGCNTSCVDSSYTVTLKSGGATVSSFSFGVPNDVASFVGVWSDVAFDKLEIREFVGTDDNEYYGHFYTGATPAPQVPEPSTGELLALALSVLGSVAWWRGRHGG